MLTLQDKLALALTSAGSQRRLAALVGVSHQKIGRWLREGVSAIVDPTTGYVIRQAGAKEIPPDAAAAINTAFKLHIAVSKDQAKADGIPFNSNYPVFQSRPDLRTGAPGARVVVENTQYIKPDLRAKVIDAAQKSRRYLSASVRSTVNFVEYSRRLAAAEIAHKKLRFDTPVNLGMQKMREFLAGRILPTDNALPIYTKRENISIDARANAAQAVEKKLRQKHQHTAIDYADEFLFQLDERNRRQTNAPAKTTTKPATKRPGGKPATKRAKPRAKAKAPAAKPRRR